MDKQSIINAIVDNIVGSNYSDWYIGITDDPQRRKGEHDNLTIWHDWKADSEQIARDVEKYFLNKEMSGGMGGGDTPNSVYIYKK